MTDKTDDLPWGMKAYNAIIAALYHLECAPTTEEERKRRAIEILKEIDAPKPADCGISI